MDIVTCAHAGAIAPIAPARVLGARNYRAPALHHAQRGHDGRCYGRGLMGVRLGAALIGAVAVVRALLVLTAERDSESRSNVGVRLLTDVVGAALSVWSSP